MPRFHRYGPRFARHGHPFKGWIWIGLGMLFFMGGGGHSWWPGILVLIGLSLVMAGAWKDPQTTALPDDQWEHRPTPPATPAPASSRPVIIITPPPAPAPAPALRAELPDTCPRCGAPVRQGEVKWTSSHSAACAYCGSNIIAPKRNSNQS